MARGRPKAKAETTGAPDAPEPLATLKAQLAGDKYGYDQVQNLPPANGESYVIVW